jgi:hypothetical protein
MWVSIAADMLNVCLQGLAKISRPAAMNAPSNKGELEH